MGPTPSIARLAMDGVLHGVLVVVWDYDIAISNMAPTT